MAENRQSTALPDANLALLRQLEWRVRHAVETVLTGEYRSSFRGRGMEFDQVVKYEYGDDVRDIDWNVTARLGEPYRKKFVEEREVCLLVVFEDAPALQFGSAGRTRRETLLELAALLMLLGAVNRDRVGLIHATPDGFQFRRPLPGRGAILHTASQLLGHPAPSLLEDARPATIPWDFIMRAAPRHSVLLWLGPFSAAPPPEAWTVLRRRYQTMGFRADDPWDIELPPDARFPVFDPVSGRILQVDTASRAQREAHAQWRRRRDAAFAELFPNTRDRLVIRTDEEVLDAMVRFFHRRNKAAAGTTAAAPLSPSQP
ncbi:MAG: DUF58 domain-containing protein [Verrucomicrobia bacterium]|nr:MAG: DUF58 domain-containing protein [Verrucomicrobiota bacterium]